MLYFWGHERITMRRHTGLRTSLHKGDCSSLREKTQPQIGRSAFSDLRNVKIVHLFKHDFRTRELQISYLLIYLVSPKANCPEYHVEI